MRMIMSENIEDLTVNYEDDGKLTVKELGKKVLTKGAWSTIMYKYQQWDNKLDGYGAVKYSIRRYQKRNGIYSQRSKFNLSLIHI